MEVAEWRKRMALGGAKGTRKRVEEETKLRRREWSMVLTCRSGWQRNKGEALGF